jgi:hypothetical protein
MKCGYPIVLIKVHARFLSLPKGEWPNAWAAACPTVPLINPVQSAKLNAVSHEP